MSRRPPHRRCGLFQGKDRHRRQRDRHHHRPASLQLYPHRLQSDRLYGGQLHDRTDPDERSQRSDKLRQHLRRSKPAYLELAKAFNFNTDGTVELGKAQTTAQTAGTTNLYFSRYNDSQDAADEKAINLYKAAISEIDTVDEFLGKKDVYQFALKAVGIDPDEVPAFTISRVLKSDLSDPKSYVYTLKDERYLTLAKAFNFGKDGNVTVPLTAQSQGTIRRSPPTTR